MNTHYPTNRTRRRTSRLRFPVALGVFLVVVIAAAACGGGNDTPDSPPTSNQPTSTASSSQPSEDSTGGNDAGEKSAGEESTETSEAAAATRTVTDWRGRDIEIPDRPLRIATFDVTPTMNLALLGIQPLTAPLDMSGPFGNGFDRFVPDTVDLESYEVIGFASDLNLEALAALEPDLIMGFNSIEQERPEAFDILSSIAPTVLYEFGTNASWRERFAIEAEIVGRQDEAAALQADYEAAFDLVADITETEFAFVRFEIDGGGNWRLENPDTSIPGSVLQDAGVTMWPPPEGLGDFNDNGSFIPDVSGELLDELQAGFLIVQDLSQFGQDDPVGLFAANPLWERLRAVAAGNVATLPAFVFNGGTNATGILTLEAVAEAAQP